MSRFNPYEVFTPSDWARVPADILLVILGKLDKKSLFNSMCVNEHWREVVKYYCKHFKAWSKVVDEATNNNALTLRAKSNLGDKGLVINALRWFNVKNAAIRLNRQYDFEDVRSICIYKGNLIVVANVRVQYYDIFTSQLIKTVNSSSVKYIETSSFIVELCDPCWFGAKSLTVTNKLHIRNCTCIHPDQRFYYNVTFWRIHYGYCYILNSNKILERLKVDKCKWIFKIVTKYYKYCHRDFICGMHLHKREIYVLMRNGDVYHTDFYGFETGKVCQLVIPLHYLNTKPYMFGTYSAIYAVSPREKFQIHFQEKEQIVVACPGLTCATEHGHMLLLGYEDGKIEIFRTTNLRKILPPEIQFNLQSYSESLTTKIIALDVYDDKNCHHVFAATESSVYEFFLYDN